MELKLSIDTLHDFLAEVFPQLGDRIHVLEMEAGRLRAELHVSEQDLRPGGTVSGPALFTLADCAFYMAVLSVIGPEALTVTTSCTINFMRKPPAADIEAEARILKLGRTLAVGDVMLFAKGGSDPVAHASVTYSIPPKAIRNGGI